jgi:hypothetical protein
MCGYINVSHYKGVDSSQAWISEIRSKVPAHFTFSAVFLGLVSNWGFPSDSGNRSLWSQYSVGALALEETPFDFYFVHGRFRVACVCAAFLHASLHRVAPNHFYVGLHDFRERTARGVGNTSYGDILDIAVVIEGFNPLIEATHGARISILQRRAGVADSKLISLWEVFREMPGR